MALAVPQFQQCPWRQSIVASLWGHDVAGHHSSLGAAWPWLRTQKAATYHDVKSLARRPKMQKGLVMSYDWLVR